MKKIISGSACIIASALFYIGIPSYLNRIDEILDSIAVEFFGVLGLLLFLGLFTTGFILGIIGLCETD